MGTVPVVAVVGPTATGKTGLAVELALRFGGEVVSADSMQVYRGLEVGTARPSEEEMRGVPHHMVGCADPRQPFSVADYVAAASECIRGIRGRGRLPVVAGGTGLYVRSLLGNIGFAPEGRSDALRAELRQKAREEGTQSLLAELRTLDPESAERIDPHNAARLIRAIEICRVTGLTMTEQLRRSKENPPPYDVCMIGLSYRDRAKLYAAIDRRVDEMMRRGLLREAEAVLRLPDGCTAKQAIGYKEFVPYFRGESTLEEAVESVKRESRRYAKRQLTWFRRDENAAWILRDDFASSDGVLARSSAIVEGKGWRL